MTFKENMYYRTNFKNAEEYVNEYYFDQRDQDLIVNNILSTPYYKMYNIINQFYCYNTVVDEIYETEDEFKNSHLEINRIARSKEETSKANKDDITSSNSYEELIIPNSSLNDCPYIIFFHKELKWIKLTDLNYANLLLDLGLPILKKGGEKWWGKFTINGFKPQDDYLHVIRSFEANVRYEPTENFLLIREKLSNAGLFRSWKESNQYKSSRDTTAFNGIKLAKDIKNISKPKGIQGYTD
jgi:hypothetical protein